MKWSNLHVHVKISGKSKKLKVRTMVWKQEWSCTRNGGLLLSASTRFSTIVHSTSSSCMMISFLSILIAYNSSVPLRSASITLPKDPLPSTIKKLKSVALMTSFLPMLCGTSLSAARAAFLVNDVFWKEASHLIS